MKSGHDFFAWGVARIVGTFGHTKQNNVTYIGQVWPNCINGWRGFRGVVKSVRVILPLQFKKKKTF